jgi:hypothetical protein
MRLTQPAPFADLARRQNCWSAEAESSAVAADMEAVRAAGRERRE